MLITEFYADQEIFITGGSGFIGKALIEKILYSCPRVGKVFVLLRNKKGKSVEERLHEILSTSLFNRLRKEWPENLSKVHAIGGDCKELGLGISAEDLEKLKNVSMIYHSAANVRFDDHLREAILINTRGTYELVKIAEKLPRLKAFIHVSTTYSNPDKHVVEEQIYEPYADWRTTIKLAETYDLETLNILNLKYSSNQPNTYTFTKSLSEQVINDHRHKLPLMIFRPSIVIASIKEPVPGWVDNFNGPIGMLVACGVGILRSNYLPFDVAADYVPVDVVVRALLIAGYKISTAESSGPDKPLQVINCATSSICSITIREIIELGRKCVHENPFEKTLWMPGGSITRCATWNFIRLTIQVVLSILVDCILRLAKEKPFLLKLQRRIFAANAALYTFLTTEWTFKNDNFIALDHSVALCEVEEFGFLQYCDIDYEIFIRNGLRGAKEFLLREPPVSSKQARQRMHIFKTMHFIIQWGTLLWIAWLALNYCRQHVVMAEIFN